MTTENYQLGINLVIHTITGKWKPLIICTLGINPHRYNELIKIISQNSGQKLSKKVLTEQLRQLERDHIVKRTNYGTIPPKVVYSLTNQGERLRNLMAEMTVFGEQMAQELNTKDRQIHIQFPYPAIFHGLSVNNKQ